MNISKLCMVCAGWIVLFITLTFIIIPVVIFIDPTLGWGHSPLIIVSVFMAVIVLAFPIVYIASGVIMMLVAATIEVFDEVS